MQIESQNNVRNPLRGLRLFSRYISVRVEELPSRGSILFGDLKMSPREPQFQQIPTNGRKSKCYIVIQRYRSVSLVTVGSGGGELPLEGRILRMKCFLSLAIVHGC